MCGILCTILYGAGSGNVSYNCPLCPPSQTELEQLKLVANRGPDTFSQQCIPIPLAPTLANNNNISKIHLVGNVLWTQGPCPNFQPYTNSDQSSYLLFNGDIYSFGIETGDPKDTKQNDNDNDGQIFYSLLEANRNNVPEFLEAISKLEGPFAFIYLNRLTNQLWFGRDFSDSNF